MVRTPVTVTATSTAGNIGYALPLRIASGALFDSDMPARLNLLEIPQAVRAAEGTAMEFNDSAFPLPESVNVYDGTDDAFDGTNVALLMGVRLRIKGMERADLLEANGGIFGPQGKIINDRAADDVKVLVAGNPVNTNAVITMHSAPNIPKSRFIATMRFDHNHVISQPAAKTGAPVADIKKMMVWGNHSADQYPDVSHVTVADKPASELVDAEWLESFFVPTVVKHDVAIIEARGTSSVASIVSVVIDHVYNWVNGVLEGDRVTPGIYQDGSYYGVPEGLIFGMPATAEDGGWVVVDGLEISDHTRTGIEHSIKATQEELDVVRALGLIKQSACGKQPACGDLEAIVGLLLREEAFPLVG